MAPNLVPLILTDEQIEKLAQITEQDKLEAQQWSKKRKATKLYNLLTAPPQEQDEST